MQQNKFKIAVLPLNIAWGDIDENMVTAADALRHVEADTDLAVLPEMFSTGFITEPTLLAAYTEDTTAHTLETVQRWAAHFGFAIAGSVIARDNNTLFNRAFLVEPSGDIYTYDKRHLFSLGGEARTYTAGSSPSPIIRFRGCNIKLQVCYDLRFPIWSRNRDCEYDLIIYPANWPDARAYAWKHLLIARAIENQAFVVGCNRTGSDDFGIYSDGNSFIFNNWGVDIATLTAGNGSEAHPYGIVYGTIDLERLNRDRQKFPAWRDADRYTIEI